MHLLQPVPSSMVLHAVVEGWDANRLNKLICKASNILGVELHSLKVVYERFKVYLFI